MRCEYASADTCHLEALAGILERRVEQLGDVRQLGLHGPVDVHGVGYLVHCPARTLSALPGIGEATSLAVETLVRENAIDLYGFADPAERLVVLGFFNEVIERMPDIPAVSELRRKVAEKLAGKSGAK